jgi:hypothetical protein
MAIAQLAQSDRRSIRGDENPGFEVFEPVSALGRDRGEEAS